MTTNDKKLRKAQKALLKSLRNRSLANETVLAAMEQVPRELLIPEELRDRAYEDAALPIEFGQTISQPTIVAMMTQALQLQGNETVLDVGTGSGYQAAILSLLCKKVITVERIGDLSRQTATQLQELGFNNIDFHIGDGVELAEELVQLAGSFAGILVAAGAPTLPLSLVTQLQTKGRMVIPIGDHHQQSLTLVEKQEEGFTCAEICRCRFVKLLSPEAWQIED